MLLPPQGRVVSVRFALSLSNLDRFGIGVFYFFFTRTLLSSLRTENCTCTLVLSFLWQYNAKAPTVVSLLTDPQVCEYYLKWHVVVCLHLLAVVVIHTVLLFAI